MPRHSQAETEAFSTVNSAITDGTSKIICATQTVHEVNNCINANNQLTPQNMLPSYEHAFQGRIKSRNFSKKYPYP